MVIFHSFLYVYQRVMTWMSRRGTLPSERQVLSSVGLDQSRQRIQGLLEQSAESGATRDLLVPHGPQGR